jgi:hypothetical protein
MKWQGDGRKKAVLVESGNNTSICPKGMIIVITIMVLMMMIQQWDNGPRKLNVLFKTLNITSSEFLYL